MSKSEGKRLLWPAITLVAATIVFVVLAASFFLVWKCFGKGEAQTYGAFLSFAASAITALITLIYVFYTRRSLETADAAIKLQHQQWEQRVDVVPKFWIPLEQPISAKNKSLRFLDNIKYPQFSCVIWNYSEQSMLVRGIQIKDVTNGEQPEARFLPVDEVVKPHETLQKDIEYDLFTFLCNPDAAHCEQLRLADSAKVLKMEIFYVDWRGDHRSSAIYYKFYGPNLDDISNVNAGPKLIGDRIVVDKQKVQCDEFKN